MGILTSQVYLNRRTYAPLAAGDSRILLDATLTSQAAATAAGFSLSGSSHVFDERGFNGKGSGSLAMSNFSGAAAMEKTGTIYTRVERAALSFSNANNANVFSDSVGTDNNAARYLFYINNDAFTYERRIFHDGLGNNGLNFLNKANNTTATPVFNRYNSHAVPVYQDQIYCDIVWTWSGLVYYIYVDGHFFTSGVSAALPTATDMKNVRYGAQNAGAGFLGDFYIHRIQFSSAFCTAQMLQQRWGTQGDSFILGCDEGAEANGLNDGTIAQINAVQRGTSLPARNANLVKSRGQCSWMHGLQALAWQEVGAYFPYYVAAHGGQGYEKVPLHANYRDALNAYKPEFIICMQSVNDVNPSSPCVDIVGNTKSKLDHLIDGNSKLRKIMFFCGISGHQDPAKIATAGWRTEYKRLKDQLMAGLPGYRGKVEAYDLYDLWGGDNYPVTQTAGSAPTNLTTEAGNDVHPSATGHTVITQLLWPYVKRELLSLPPT